MIREYNSHKANQPNYNRKERENVFKNLDAEQARRGLTNSAAAEKLGISRVSYESKKKSGKFYVYEAKKLCELFKCEFDYLFETEK